MQLVIRQLGARMLRTAALRCLFWAVLGVQWAVRAVVWAWSHALALTTPRRRLPPPQDPLLLLPATTLAARIRSGQVSSESVVRAYGERVSVVQPMLNAVVEHRLEEALEEARHVDQLVACGDAPPAHEQPLLGVPFTVKGSLAVKGLCHACANVSRAGVRADQDALVVRQLRAAGAIPLLVSTTPEYCLFFETYSQLHGVTRNPYDTRRTPGGSSGGEAALLGAGASLVSLASDVGGSARLPALFCGVFGHKPTAGVVSDEGHLPVATDPRWPDFFSVSPMCRYAVDLPAVLHAMAGKHAPRLRLLQPVDVKTLRVLYMEENGSMTSSRVQPELKEAMHKVIQTLNERQNIRAEKVQIKAFAHSLELTGPTIVSVKGLQDPMAPKYRDSLGTTLLHFMTGQLPHNAYVLAYELGYGLQKLTPDDVKATLNKATASFKLYMRELLRDDGVLLYPTYVAPAGYLYNMYGNLVNAVYTAIFNLLGLPATHCPTGLSREGLPLGIQVVAGPDQDRLCLAVAREIEAALGGWVPPP
ncbi:fatty-acid amide hydrolase 2-A-like isoform X1 [Schistocerca piceifrons]|uniref:fatty-acid amide hydrolase 2-A-like isoform X1 n=2 Tax=Schistocerca piceifrons TaxID=274613 RepID=UPI001F5FDF1E|nr:fatty-acid amide hydrolase 2-A-like isoform X1 [Schistocerca piceifrons]